MAFNMNSNDAPAKALQMLKRVRKLDGAALISGGVLLHDDCPRGSDSKLLSQSVVRLFEGLEELGEYADDILLRFDGGDLLLMFRCPIILCLFFNRKSDLSSIEKGGSLFLYQFSSALGILNERPKRKVPAPLAIAGPATIIEKNDSGNDREAWEQYRRQVETLFTKVLGSAQASRMISREITEMGVTQTGYLRKPQFRPFGQKLTQKIKDKAVRRQIEDELVHIIDEIL
jgi:hypothetical protein